MDTSRPPAPVEASPVVLGHRISAVTASLNLGSPQPQVVGFFFNRMLSHSLSLLLNSNCAIRHADAINIKTQSKEIVIIMAVFILLAMAFTILCRPNVW